VPQREKENNYPVTTNKFLAVKTAVFGHGLLFTSAQIANVEITCRRNDKPHSIIYVRTVSALLFWREVSRT
jgi:hypothetical protein